MIWLYFNESNLFFGVGVINTYGNVAMYRVKSVKDITNIIIPHFIQYPLITQKGADFKLFNTINHVSD
jgi:hypothetical protein